MLLTQCTNIRLSAAAVSACLSGAVVLAITTPSPQSSPFVSTVGNDLVVIGTAEHANHARAEEYSRQNAIYRAATELNQRLTLNPDAPQVLSFKDLFAYVRRFSRLTSRDERESTTSHRFTSELRLDRSFLDPVRIQSMRQPRRGNERGIAEGYLRVNKERFGEMVTPTEHRTLSVAVRAGDQRDGRFTFMFGWRIEADELWLTLRTIVVEQDGSAGGATWRFSAAETVRLDKGGGEATTACIDLPDRSYDDDVGRYDLDAAEPSRMCKLSLADARNQPNLQLQIEGHRR